MLFSALIVSSSLAALPAPPRPRKVPSDGGVAGATCDCAADLDQSGSINAADLSILLGAWGGTGVANLDGTGTVDAADLSILLGAWGPCVPANDTCQTAIPIAPGVTPFCTLGAASDGPALPGSGGCNLAGFNQIDHDIWYDFVAPSDGVLKVSTCGTTWDTKIAMYGSTIPGFSACPSSGISASTFLGCSDDDGDCGLASFMERNVVAGEHYKLRVGGFGSYSGTGELHLDFTPEGVDCEHAILIDPAYDVLLDGSNIYTPLGINESPCGSVADGHSIWYRFTPECQIPGSVVTISTCHPGTDFDTVLTIWRIGTHGECAQTYIECNDDYEFDLACLLNFQPRRSKLHFNTVPGWIYYIQVSGFNGAVGHFELSLTMDSCP